MKTFVHRNAKSIDEAVSILKKYGGKAKINAGGTDLLDILKERNLTDYPEAIVNIKSIEGLDSIREDGEGLKIGAAAKLSQIATSPVVNGDYKALAEAVRSVATPLVRNMGTLGGNLAQDVRCWYYRYPQALGGPIVCLRKGGKVCNALFGDNRYHSVFGRAPMEQYPCSSHCPAKTDIPFYLSKVKNGDLADAARTLLEVNPMPAVTGRVCPTFCEPECNREGYDEPVAIRCVERFLGDYILQHPDRFFTPPDAESGKKVAIVGSGPAGLGAAYYLRKEGHGVTVFERSSEAGGMLSCAIPPYRLPKEVVKQEIHALEGMGISFQLGVNVGTQPTVGEIMERFDAVFVAAGAWKERSLGIKGEEIALSGLAFLNRVNAGSREIPGKRVAIVGGGNVAMDVARTLIRLGAKPVVLYRRSRNEMPALKDEIVKAEEDGVPFRFLALPVEAARVKDKIVLTCRRMKLGPPDESGRRSPAPRDGSDFTITVDAVIKAIGEEPDMSFLPQELRSKVRNRASSPLMLGKNLFAGGDFVSGPSTVIEAVTSGREAARILHLSLGGGRLSLESHGTEPNFTIPSYDAAPRAEIPAMATAERIRGMDEEETAGLAAEAVVKEARRCFNCGCVAVGPSDIGTALVALDARIVTTKRILSPQEFFTATATCSNVLEGDELVTEIQVPKPPEGARQSYIKFAVRNPVDFAIVGLASVITIRDGACLDARIVLGAVGPSPIRVHAAEELLKGKPIDEPTASAAAEAAIAEMRPLSGNEYKIEIARSLVKRAIMESLNQG